VSETTRTWELYEVDTTRVTDVERLAKRVRTLAEQRAMADELNRTSPPGKVH
jgi:hypothetical protein